MHLDKQQLSFAKISMQEQSTRDKARQAQERKSNATGMLQSLLGKPAAQQPTAQPAAPQVHVPAHQVHVPVPQAHPQAYPYNDGGYQPVPSYAVSQQQYPMAPMQYVMAPVQMAAPAHHHPMAPMQQHRPLSDHHQAVLRQQIRENQLMVMRTASRHEQDYGHHERADHAPAAAAAQYHYDDEQYSGRVYERYDDSSRSSHRAREHQGNEEDYAQGGGFADSGGYAHDENRHSNWRGSVALVNPAHEYNDENRRSNRRGNVARVNPALGYNDENRRSNRRGNVDNGNGSEGSDHDVGNGDDNNEDDCLHPSHPSHRYSVNEGRRLSDLLKSSLVIKK
jgi:hypothetical protein